GNPVFDASGRFKGYRCTTRDETAEVEARRLATLLESRFRALFTHNPEPVWVVDRETMKFIEVNEAAVTRYGYSREEFLAMRVPDIESKAELAGPAEEPAGRNEPSEEGERQHHTRSRDAINVQNSGHDTDLADRAASRGVAHD